MAAIHINSETRAPTSGRSAIDVNLSPSTTPVASDPDTLTGAAVVLPESHPRHHRLLASPSSSAAPPTSSLSSPTPSRSSISVYSLAPATVQPTLSIEPALQARKGLQGNNITSSSNTSAFFPLFFKASTKTPPATSLVGAEGKSIPIDNTVVTNRTSTLRELNTNFPSPVFRHRAIKSAGTTDTIVSKPVIVKTYSGPSPSPSSSAHYRRQNSNSRTGSRSSGQRRIPLSAGSNTTTAVGNGTNGGKHALGAGWGIRESLFGMAGKKGGFLSWPWASDSNDIDEEDEAKLPPIEAFSFKGFMADLQATTDIRSDLDRIAEICARSRYSLSNQYDSHVTPHGSGAGFVSVAGQPSIQTRSRRKGPPMTSGPTLQPSADTGNPRSHRRQGGAGGNRRRSVAYGTLETIMSSSRSSEEDKSKKQSANAIIEEVRGRASRKASRGSDDNTTEGISERNNAIPSFHNVACNKSKGKKPASFGSDQAKQTHYGDIPSSPASALPERASRRRKSTSLAHAMMDSNRQQKLESDAGSRDASSASRYATVSAALIPDLLSEPALPQTSGNNMANSVLSRTRLSSDTGGAHADADLAICIVSVGDSGSQDTEAAGLLTGISQWLPWTTGANGIGNYQGHNHSVPHRNAFAGTYGSSSGGPINAEVSLRELLKAVDTNKQDKGKAVDGDI